MVFPVFGLIKGAQECSMLTLYLSLLLTAGEETMNLSGSHVSSASPNTPVVSRLTASWEIMVWCAIGMRVEYGEELMVTIGQSYSSFNYGDLRIFAMGLLIWGRSRGCCYVFVAGACVALIGGCAVLLNLS